MALTIERGDTSRSKDPRDLCNRPCSKLSHGVHHNRGDGDDGTEGEPGDEVSFGEVAMEKQSLWSGFVNL